MGVKIVTKKKTNVDQTEEVVDVEKILNVKFSDRVDSMRAMSDEVKDLKDKLAVLEKNFKAGKTEILEELDKHEIDDDLTFTITGNQHLLVVGKQPKTSEIVDKEALYHELESKQEGLFFELAAIGITKIKEYIGENHPFIKKVAKGDRKMTFK